MKIRPVVYFAVGAVLTSAGVGWWRADARRTTVLTGLPPETTAQPDAGELRTRLATVRVRTGGLMGGAAALGELSRLYHANGFSREAIQCYVVLEKLTPTEPRWLHRHATLLAGLGDTEAAAERWGHVRTMAPDYLGAQVRLGDLLLKENQATRAAAVFEAILNREKDHPHAMLGLARLDLEAGRWTEARERLEKVVAKTNYALGYDLIVTVWEHFGEHTRAAEMRGRAKASGAYRDVADPWIEELMGDCYDVFRLTIEAGAAGRRGEGATARRWLERAVGLAPDDVAPRFQLAALLAEQGDAISARREWERCTTVSPTFADAWAQWAASLRQARDQTGAERVLTAGLRACPESAGLWLMRARQFREAGRTAEAVSAYETAIRYRTNEADAFLELATTLFRMERVPEGLQRLAQGLAAEPEHPPTLALLAFHAITSGDEAAARAWMLRVARQPRVAREQEEKLRAAFRERFGRTAP
jgi:tetratricopeptide (TPR) repeat protein